MAIERRSNAGRALTSTRKSSSLVGLKSSRAAKPHRIERVKHDNARSFHQRYLDIFNIVERCDREMERIFDDLKRSIALMMLAQLRANGVLTGAEFSSLSPETRSAIGLLLGSA
jgi:hypothetical protein